MKTYKKAHKMNYKHPVTFFSLFALGIVAATPAAHAISNIKSPFAEEGEIEAEYRGEWHHDDNKSNKNAQEHVLGLGYGFAPKWFAEGEFEFAREAGESMDLEKIELELKHQFTDHGDYWWDVGALAYYKYGVDSDTKDQVEGWLLLQNTYRHFTTRVNVELEHTLGQDGGDIDLETRAFTRYNLSAALKPAIEWHANYNDIDHIRNTEHYIGPAAYGHLTFLEELIAGDGEFEYELAYLFGITDAASDGAVRWKLEYKTHF